MGSFCTRSPILYRTHAFNPLLPAHISFAGQKVQSEVYSCLSVDVLPSFTKGRLMQACTFSRHASLHQIKDRQASHASASSSAPAASRRRGYHQLKRGCLQTRQSLSDAVEDVLVLGTIASSVIAIGATAIAGARAGAKAAQPRTSRPNPDDNDEDFSYAIMGVVGCIPLFSWTVRT
jgi:hypothetical protein